ncbi:MAG TPA: DNA glycosylase [Methanoregulaceae archaeon]|nr:DNA glycosylase [Methanoregulaceae archaeon]
MNCLTFDRETPFDLGKTLSCGQVFRWTEEEGGMWTGIIGDEVVTARQEGNRLFWNGTDEDVITRYFSLDIDLPTILDDIDRDPVIHRAIARSNGLRIIRQAPWECLASYIIATFTNIPSIKRRIGLLCQAFGKEILAGEVVRYSFPAPGSLVEGRDCLFETCRLGYRAPFLCETAGLIAADPEWADRLASFPYEDARSMLMRYKGAGRKVADCVLLFGFERLNAFPVDVWIERILRAYYLDEPAGAISYEYMRHFAQDYFGEYAGYAQEYLFSIREELFSKNLPGKNRKEYPGPPT